MAPDVTSNDACYLPSLERAWGMLGTVDLMELASRSGGDVGPDGLSLEMLEGKTVVDVEKRDIRCTVPEAGLLLDVVVLHYLKGCLDHEIGPNEDWLLFRQLNGGEVFQAAFQKRVVEVIAERFSSRPKVLVEAGLKLKGRTERFGSATVVLPFLPRLHIRVTVWQGDDEVPGNATMLFSPGAGSLLPTEDFSEVGSVVMSALLRSSSSDR